MIASARWSIAGQASVAALQLFQIVILARWLTPAEFGIGAVYLLLVGVGQLFWDFGTSAAVIQSRNVNTDQLSTLYSLNLALGLLFAVLLWFVAPVLAGALLSPDAVSILRWAGASALISAAGGQHRALFLKDLRFRRVALFDMIAALLSCCAAILAAYLGGNAYAFVAAGITSAVASSLLLVASGLKSHPPSLGWQPSSIRYFLSFGAYQSGSSLINFAYLNLDLLILAGLLNAADLGKYSLAKQICMRPLELIYPIFIRSTLPLLARLQENKAAFSQLFLRAQEILNAIYLPLFAALVVTADVLVPMLFGDKWRDAVPIVQILAAAHAARFLMTPTAVSLMASGAVSLGFYWDMAASGLLVAALYLSQGGGIVGMTASILFAYVFLLLPHWYFVVRVNLALTFVEWFGAFVRPISASVLAAGAAYIASMSLRSPINALTTMLAVGLVVYVSLSYFLNRSVLLALNPRPTAELGPRLK